MDRVWDNHLQFWGNHKHRFVGMGKVGAGYKLTYTGCTGKGRGPRHMSLHKDDPLVIQKSEIQKPWVPRSSTNEGHDLGTSLSSSAKWEAGLHVELPKFKYSLVTYQNKTLGTILNFLMSSFPSFVKWWQEQNTSLTVLLQRHGTDSQAWHMIGI